MEKDHRALRGCVKARLLGSRDEGKQDDGPKLIRRRQQPGKADGRRCHDERRESRCGRRDFVGIDVSSSVEIQEY